MKCIVVFLLFTLQCVICSAIVQHSAYNPVFEYDVPVASQPIYAAPAVQTGPYYGSYAVHTTPAVSHTYSQTQTHPVTYVKPVTVYGAQSSQYYAPSAPTSRVEHSRLIVPQTNRIYRYQSTNQQYAYPQQSGVQFRNQQPGQNAQGEKRTNQQTYSTQAKYNANDRSVYANRMPYTNNGEQVRRYQIYRPGIKKEFYDVEERIIVRPVGSALIELDPPSKKQDITESRPSNNNNFDDSQRFRTNGRSNSAFHQNEQYYSTSIPDCGYVYENQSPVYEYSPPATSFESSDDNSNQQPYHPTTFAPPSTTTTTANNYPTTAYPSTVPSQTYLPPYSTEQSFTSSSSSEYTPTTGYPTTPNQYTPTTTYPTAPDQYTPTTGYPTTPDQYTPTTGYPTTPDQYTPTKGYPTTPNQYTPTDDSSTTPQQSKTPQQSDIYISSTTPVTVTIVDKNSDSNQTRTSYQNRTTYQDNDIQYAYPQQQQQQAVENPDQFQNELPPRGDISQYRAEQPDQFFYELPSSRISNQPDTPIVYSRSRGDPSIESPFDRSNDDEVVTIKPPNDRVSTNNQNRTSYNQARLIQLYTGNGGVSEVGQTESEASSRYSNQHGGRNAQYQDVGNVRARVVSVTPPPATAIPTETVNKRRIIVSKPVTTVQEVVELNNSGNNNTQSSNYRYNEDYDEYNQNSYQRDSDSQSKSNYEDRTSASSSTGVYISTTPSSASQRIIYVQPVSQDFAQQRARAPKNQQ